MCCLGNGAPPAAPGGCRHLCTARFILSALSPLMLSGAGTAPFPPPGSPVVPIQQATGLTWLSSSATRAWLLSRAALQSDVSSKSGATGVLLSGSKPRAEDSAWERREIRALQHERLCGVACDLAASFGDLGAADVPEQAGQGLASPALLGTRLWGLKTAHGRDSEMEMGTIPSEGRAPGSPGRVRRVLPRSAG